MAGTVMVDVLSHSQPDCVTLRLWPSPTRNTGYVILYWAFVY